MTRVNPPTRIKLGAFGALTPLLDYSTSELDKPSVKFMQLAGIDFSEALDRLQPPILIHNMGIYGFNENITKIVVNFIQNRQQSVKYNDHYQAMCASWHYGRPSSLANKL